MQKSGFPKCTIMLDYGFSQIRPHGNLWNFEYLCYLVPYVAIFLTGFCHNY